MKHWIAIILAACLGLSVFTACSVPEIHIQPGNAADQEEVPGNQEDGAMDTTEDSFVYMKPSEEDMAQIEVLSGADFSTISMEALQGYWYCNEGYGYEMYLEVVGEVAIIRETVDGVVQEVWNGNGPATILPPGESGWKNPGLDIRTEDGDSIAMLVLRRVGDGYFTTANSGTFYKVEEK